MATESVKIHPTQIQKGMYIELPIPWNKNPFVMRKFKVHFDYQVNIIRDLNLEYVLYYPSKSDAEPLPASSQAEKPAETETKEDTKAETQEQLKKLEWEKAERVEQLKAYRRSLQKTEKEFENSLKKIKNIMSQMGSRPLNAIGEATALVNSITDAILGADNLVLHLMTDAKGGDNMYYHSLNVTVLSLMVAKAAKIGVEEGYDLGLGSMFHDVGKLKVPKKILLKKEKLNHAELKMLQLHPKYGVHLLTITKEFPEKVLPIIEQHHEYLDGTGYPDGLKEEKLSALAQIVAVVNTYDNLCHPADGSEGTTPSGALSYIFKNMTGKLNKKYVDMLVKLLGVYPPGSVVGLSDGGIGLVMSVNSKDLLNPQVLLYDPSIPRAEAPAIDLSTTDIKIKKVFKPSQLKKEAMDYLSPRSQLNYAYYFDEAG